MSESSPEKPNAAVEPSSLRNELNGIWFFVVLGVAFGAAGWGCNPAFLCSLSAVACGGSAMFKLHQLDPDHDKPIDGKERVGLWGGAILAILLAVVAPVLEAFLAT